MGSRSPWRNPEPVSLRAALTTALALALLGCGDGGGGTGPNPPPDSLDTELRARLHDASIVPLAPLPAQNPDLVALGRALMFDKVLSGNLDVSCATCHNPAAHTSDGLSLSIGTGGVGTGTGRGLGTARQFVSRNAQDLFNRGDPAFTSMFWDGRVADAGTGFRTPAGDILPAGLNGPLAAQAMIPVFTRVEMRGQPGDLDRFGRPNELAALGDDDFAGVWRALMSRLLALDGYVGLFRAAYPDVPTNELGFQHAANAIAAFEAEAFASAGSPFDRYVAGDNGALSAPAKRGADLFLGDAGCAQCHRGPELTDQQFHNIGVPQIGPGFGAASPEDHGHGEVTGSIDERSTFRTPPLRNVELTAPYMHDGAYISLEAAVRHYIDPSASLANYDPAVLRPELQGTYLSHPAQLEAILQTLDERVAVPLTLSDTDVADIVEFLRSLTDPAAVDMSALVPETVPSGLPVGEAAASLTARAGDP
jgi:cytochrome c peroxidase